MSKNYFVIATVASLAITVGVLGYDSTANAWGGSHHAQGEYHHTATRGAYVTSAPQHLRRNADPNCPYYSAVEGQTSQSQTTSQPSGNGRHHGNRGNNYGAGYHRSTHAAHHANCENCPYAAQSHAFYQEA